MNTRVVLGWALLVSTLIGWPLSLIFMTEEPPVVLSLSWLALTLTAIDIIFTARIEK